VNVGTRALVVTPDFPPVPGGIQLLMHRLVANLDSVEVKVISLGAPGAHRFDAGSSLDVIRVARKGGGLNKLAVARLNATVLRHGLRFRPDVIVSWHAVLSPACASLRLMRKIPVIQYLHGDEARHRPKLVGFAVRNADAVIAVSRHSSELAKAAGVDPRRIHVVHPGVDMPARRSNGRAGRPTVLTVSRMHDSYKGHDMLVRALPEIRERVPAVQWVVIGDGPLRPMIEAMAAEHGLAESVRFLGRVSDEERDQWLDRSHVFALPSRLPPEGTGGEGFGIVYLEAGAHGMPVVGAAEGGALDAVVDGETGLLVDPRDHRELADSIAGLLLDSERAAALGEAGRQRASDFTWERHARAVATLANGLNGRA
jgi:phosphatidyl-myo-inositol dimannoside synthase